MPAVTLRTTGPDGTEETLTEYICDWPSCPNVATRVLGVVVELRAMAAVCAEHAVAIADRRNQNRST